MGIYVVICLSAVWSVLHIKVEPMIIVLALAIILVLGVTQCENTIKPYIKKFKGIQFCRDLQKPLSTN